MSAQRFIARNRAPRVQIEYDVELYGAQKKVQLPFVIGVMADLSGSRAEPLPPVQERKFLEISNDNFDDRLRGMRPRLAMQVPNTLDGEGSVDLELRFESMHDFSPDSVVRQVPVLARLLDVRTQLANLVTYIDGRPEAEKSIGRLLGDPALIETPDFMVRLSTELKTQDDRTRGDIESAVRALAHQALAAAPASSPDVVQSIASIVAALDERLTRQVNLIIHHRDFLDLEGSWRGLHYFVHNTETDPLLKIRVLNISKKELGKTLKRFKGVAWDQSPIFKKIYVEEYGQLGGEPYGCLIGDYYFDCSPADVELLGELSKIGAAAHAPFIGAASPTLFQMDSWQEISNPRDVARIFSTPEYAAWRSLRESEDARYIGLTLPRFLARRPYGAKSDPVDAFDFEEDTSGRDLGKFVWANSAYAMAVNIARSFKLYGWCSRIRGIESGGAVAGLPTHTFPTDDGGVDMTCPTEVAISDRREAELAKIGLMPLIHKKHSDFAAFIGAQSLLRSTVYDDPDATANAALSGRLPYLFATCRFAQYLKCMVRDKIGSFKEREDMQRWLQDWISQYVDDDPSHSSEERKARKPLAAAEIVLDSIDGNPGYYTSSFFLRPHYQLEGLTMSLRLVSKLPTAKTG
jgi:type VI secretion system protein ImpC